MLHLALALSLAASSWAGSEQTIDNLATRTEKAAKEKSPLAIGLLYGMWNMNRLLDAPDRVERAVTTVLALAKGDPLLAAHASYVAIQLAERRGRIDEANKMIGELGLISSAMVLGPFENSAAQGHEEPFPPEVELNLDEATPGKGHPVRWREVQTRGVFELSTLLYPPVEGSAYVLVALESNAPVLAALRTGSIDQLKVFFEGKEIYTLDTRRGAAIDQDAIPLSIPRGLSVLMLKSSWTGNNGRVLFRLTKPDGAKLDGVTVRGDRATIARAIAEKRATPAKAAHKVTAVHDALDRAITRAKGTELALALAVRADLYAVLGLYDRRKLPTPPERDLEAAIKLAPQDPLMKFFYAHRVEERDPSLAHEALHQALAIDPNHAPSLYKLGETARGAGRFVEARDLLERAVKADPKFVPAIAGLATLRFDTGADRELSLIELANAAERVPSPMIWAELAHMRRALDDRKGARIAAERALELDASQMQTRAIVSAAYVEAGELTKALEIIDGSLAFEPWNLGHYLRKAQILAASDQKIPDALAVLDRAASLFPDSPEVPAQIAELHLWKNDDRAAIVALERALELDPFLPELRRHRGALSGQKGELEDEYTIDAAQLAKAPVGKEEASFGAIYLADRTAIRLYENGQSTRFQQMILRLKNPNLKDALRVHRLAYAPTREVLEVLTAERLRPNGEVIKASSINDEGETGKVSGMYVDRRIKTIVFDDLAEGDLVHIRYRTDSIGQNMFGNFFGDMQHFQDQLPKRGLLYVVIGPKSRPLYFGLMKSAAPKKEELGNNVKLTWSIDQIAGLENEPFSPPYPDIGSLVNVSTYKSWEDLGRWYAGLFADQLELDATAREGGKRAIAGAKTEAEKIRALYSYVVKNTRYVGIELGIHGWKPFKAAEVHRRRYGDCKDKATLLAALLRDNNIDATIALVRTADHGLIETSPATMWAFNHAITYVPSLDLYLDGTAEFSGSNELPWQDQGAMVLVVHPDGKTKLATLPISKAEDNLNRSSYTATIDKNGALELKGREEFFGARASQLRQEFEEVEQRRGRLEKQLNQVFNGVHVEELTFSDMNDLEKPVYYDYVAAIDRYGTMERGRYVLPLTLFEHQVANAYASLAKRKYDLYSNHAWATRNVVRYQLPEGAKIESLPEGVNIDSKHVSVTQTVRAVPGGFETDDTVTLKSRRVPAADYDELRRACLAIDRALGRSVVIRW